MGFGWKYVVKRVAGQRERSRLSVGPRPSPFLRLHPSSPFHRLPFSFLRSWPTSACRQLSHSPPLPSFSNNFPFQFLAFVPCFLTSAMHWWQNIAFSPSSSSSSSSSRRRLTRAKKLRHLEDGSINALVKSRSSTEQKDLVPVPSSCSNLELSSGRPSSVVPQPLPLPELALVFRRNGGSNSNSNWNSDPRPLPWPKEVPSRGVEDKDKGNSLVGDGNGEMFVASTATAR